jgi:hypothetical protein
MSTVCAGTERKVRCRLGGAVAALLLHARHPYILAFPSPLSQFLHCPLRPPRLPALALPRLQVIQTIWMDVLGITDPISIDADYFDIGGEGGVQGGRGCSALMGAQTVGWLVGLFLLFPCLLARIFSACGGPANACLPACLPALWSSHTHTHSLFTPPLTVQAPPSRPASSTHASASTWRYACTACSVLYCQSCCMYCT